VRRTRPAHLSEKSVQSCMDNRQKALHERLSLGLLIVACSVSSSMFKAAFRTTSPSHVPKTAVNLDRAGTLRYLSRNYRSQNRTYVILVPRKRGKVSTEPSRWSSITPSSKIAEDRQNTIGRRGQGLTRDAAAAMKTYTESERHHELALKFNAQWRPKNWRVAPQREGPSRSARKSVRKQVCAPRRRFQRKSRSDSRFGIMVLIALAVMPFLSLFVVGYWRMRTS